MVRKSVRVAGRLALSAAISWTLIPIAVADAPATPAAEQATTGLGMDEAVKKLHSVPEDGIGDKNWLSGATRVVRELMAKRPKEDLIICIAGCVEKQDRVVYAQPGEEVSVKPAETISNAAPAAVAPQADAKQPSAEPVKTEPVKNAVKVISPAGPSENKQADGKPMAAPAAVTPVAAPAKMPDAAAQAAKAPEANAPENKAPEAKAPETADAVRPALAPAARTAPVSEPVVPQFMPSSAAPKSEAAPAAKPAPMDSASPDRKAEPK